MNGIPSMTHVQTIERLSTRLPHSTYDMLRTAAWEQTEQ
jgi:hypothetical protein